MSTQQTPPPEPTGRPGRYNRSAAGLVVSLLVTVVAIGGLLYFMGTFRHELEIEPERVDHLQSVEAAQQAGLEPVYPPELPSGWIATGVDVVPGDDAAVTIRMLTDEERFVGIHQEDASGTVLLSRWVDEETEPAEGYSVPDSVERPVARHWEGYTDAGGDTAYVATVGEETVIVFGSAPAEEIQAIVDSLVVRPVG